MSSQQDNLSSSHDCHIWDESVCLQGNLLWTLQCFKQERTSLFKDPGMASLSPWSLPGGCVAANGEIVQVLQAISQTNRNPLCSSNYLVLSYVDCLYIQRCARCGAKLIISKESDYIVRYGFGIVFIYSSMRLRHKIAQGNSRACKNRSLTLSLRNWT